MSVSLVQLCIYCKSPLCVSVMTKLTPNSHYVTVSVSLHVVKYHQESIIMCGLST